ncbi:FAS-associated death domain protein [Genypterus blacodes]|uniref:FAS-associated death domain protein n=1 Tax=Genypterus blacodes TaxID=154954 RepID=UPI003F778061
MASMDFNSVLLQISDNLPMKQLERLTFMCRDDVGKKDRETIDTGFKLFQLLIERQKLGPQNRDYLCDKLSAIQRLDLSDTLRDFTAAISEQHLGPEETANLNIAKEVLVETVGKHWRKLGRKLGLSETKLESVSKRHPTDLEETVVELLKEWVKLQKSEATVQTLLQALRSCQLNMTADKVQERLSDRL